MITLMKAIRLVFNPPEDEVLNLLRKERKRHGKVKDQLSVGMRNGSLEKAINKIVGDLK